MTFTGPRTHEEGNARRTADQQQEQQQPQQASIRPTFCQLLQLVLLGRFLMCVLVSVSVCVSLSVAAEDLLKITAPIKISNDFLHIPSSSSALSEELALDRAARHAEA